MRREDVENVDQQSLVVCPDCRQRWEESRVVPSLSRVDWDRDVLTSEVCLYTKIYSTLLYETLFLKPLLFMKDIRLELLLKAYQDAKTLGSLDGSGKVLSTLLTTAVITHVICAEHRKCFLV